MPPPLLPASLARLSGEFLWAGARRWNPPSRAQCLEVAPLLPPAILAFRIALEPAEPIVIDWCLASLAVTTAPRGASSETELTWQLRSIEMRRLLGRFPGDIWQATCDRWVTTRDVGRWYPSVEELHTPMERALDDRKARLRRLTRMAEIAGLDPTSYQRGAA